MRMLPPYLLPPHANPDRSLWVLLRSTPGVSLGRLQRVAGGAGGRCRLAAGCVGDHPAAGVAAGGAATGPGRNGT